MDEPFGAVDRITRERLQNEFVNIQRSMRKTVVFVTHDIEEAVIVGDRLCILKMQAQIAQYDTPERVLAQPASEYVIEFLGPTRIAWLESLRRTSVQGGQNVAAGV
jgi:osmoprotectant transport system ATP-binding protein